MIDLSAIDALIDKEDAAVRDAWRIVRGALRRRERPSQVDLPAAEPITAKTHFQAATEALKRGE